MCMQYGERDEKRVGYVDTCEDDDRDSFSREIDEICTKTRHPAYVSGNSEVEPRFMKVQINGVDLGMEIDSGSAESIIPLRLVEIRMLVRWTPTVDRSILEQAGMMIVD
ncbi:hypothetical protein QAD02_013482 [Eretmocerus hayati]|uniref:Uncharacterized protein n=1 Tax=Eretmocerus hayati TaxID=131215 RepID=A0ACC2P291_9HYME|nr:hypothetical protein QAD02_013482 [Eretmocerus hayati]